MAIGYNNNQWAVVSDQWVVAGKIKNLYYTIHCRYGAL